MVQLGDRLVGIHRPSNYQYRHLPQYELCRPAEHARHLVLRQFRFQQFRGIGHRQHHNRQGFDILQQWIHLYRPPRRGQCLFVLGRREAAPLGAQHNRQLFNTGRERIPYHQNRKQIVQNNQSLKLNKQWQN